MASIEKLTEEILNKTKSLDKATQKALIAKLVEEVFSEKTESVNKKKKALKENYG